MNTLISRLLIGSRRCLHTTKSVSRNWKILKLNHVAIATNELGKISAFYGDVLGAQVSEVNPLPEHGVDTVFIDVGNTKLELLKPLGDDSPIKAFLERNKSGGIHHICMEVDNIKAAMEDLTKNKIRLLGKEPKIGAHGKPVIFIHPKDCGGVLLELEEA